MIANTSMLHVLFVKEIAARHRQCGRHGLMGEVRHSRKLNAFNLSNLPEIFQSLGVIVDHLLGKFGNP